MRRRRVEVRPLPCLVLQAKVQLVQLYCATSLLGRWPACPRHCRAIPTAISGGWPTCSALQSAAAIFCSGAWVFLVGIFFF